MIFHYLLIQYEVECEIYTIRSIATIASYMFLGDCVIDVLFLQSCRLCRMTNQNSAAKPSFPPEEAVLGKRSEKHHARAIAIDA